MLLNKESNDLDLPDEDFEKFHGGFVDTVANFEQRFSPSGHTTEGYSHQDGEHNNTEYVGLSCRAFSRDVDGFD